MYLILILGLYSSIILSSLLTIFLSLPFYLLISFYFLHFLYFFICLYFLSSFFFFYFLFQINILLRSLMAMKHAAARGEDVTSWGLAFEVLSHRCFSHPFFITTHFCLKLFLAFCLSHFFFLTNLIFSLLYIDCICEDTFAEYFSVASSFFCRVLTGWSY